MIAKTVAIVVLSIGANASLFDFMTVEKAQEAYDNKAYKKAEELYQKLEGDEARFNEADALYGQKKYQEALAKYETIKSEKLRFKKLYNMGNSYAQMKKLDEAIDAYEHALKIKEDEDARHNLELLKKKKKEQEKKQDKKQDKNQKDKNKENKDKNNKDKKEGGKDGQKKKNDDKNGKDKKPMKPQDKAKQEEQAKQNEQEKQKKKQEEAKKEEAQKKQKDKAKQEEESKTSNAQQAKKDTPISNVEERKWQKMLNQRGVNTLMIPLSNKGEKRNETNPW